MPTLLLGLVLLLVRGEEHIVRKRPAGYGAFRSHRVTLACKRPRAGHAIRQCHTALALHINGACRVVSGRLMICGFAEDSYL